MDLDWSDGQLLGAALVAAASPAGRVGRRRRLRTQALARVLARTRALAGVQEIREGLGTPQLT